MVPLAPYRPDLPALDGGAQVATNVYASAMSAAGGVVYRPVMGPVVATNALTARCQGAFSSAGTQNKSFAGDASKLYELSSATWTATDTGFNTASDGRWSFTQFGNRVIATNGVDNVQSWVLGSSTEFADLGGTPPDSKYVATVRDFVVLGNTTNSVQEIIWSGIDDPTTWTPSQTTQSDAQTLPDGGSVTGIVGGEYGVIFQQEAIRRMVYVGTPIIFQFDKVDDQNGCRYPGSIASLGPQMVFYLSDDGFYVTDGNGPSKPIGNQKIDRTVVAELNQSYGYRVTSVIDPKRRLYLCAIPTNNSADGTPDKIYAYNYEVGEWSIWDLDVELLWLSKSSSYTLEQLDSVLGYTSIETIPFSLDSDVWTGGVPQLASFDTSHKTNFFSGDNLEAVVGTQEAQIFPMRRADAYEVIPYIDGTDVTATIRVGVRENQQSTITYGSSSTVNGTGFAPVRAGGRFHRAEVTVAAASDWETIQGVDFKAMPSGAR